jgi:vancomycin resistance protein YoaR
MATPIRDESYTGATIPMRAPRRQAGPPPMMSGGRSRRSRGWWWKIPLLLLVMLCGAGIAGLTWLDNKYADKIYPNVALQGVDLSQSTKVEAQAKVQSAFGAFLDKPITISYQGTTWQPTAAELGVRVNLAQDVARAYNAGRGNGLLENIQQVGAIYQQGLDLPLRVSVDGNTLSAYLQRIAAEVDQPGREAALMIADARSQSVESVNGRMVLVDETMAEIERALWTLEPQVVTLRTSDLKPQLTSDSIAEARRTVDAMLSSPIELVFKDTSFELDQATIADMIVMQRVDSDGGTTLNAQLDQQKLEKWVTKLADKIGRSSVEPRVSWNGGNLQIIREGKIGYRLNVEHTVEMLNGAVTTISRRLELPVEEVQPRVTPENLATLGITELVSVGKSDFTGSAAYRVTNISVGMQKINGILIAPDEEFSFNENVGAIDTANGFVEGYAIVGNRTQLEPGGGICQDSTTLFRAAFYAGLPFSDWTPHRFRISWYEKYDTIGMDSTIFTGGGPDLRFINDTGNWLLIQASANPATGLASVALYGTKVPGRTVERSDAVITNETPAPTKPLYYDDETVPPGAFKQTDTARGGMDIQITRTILQDGVAVNTRKFVTKFAPWPNIFLKNPKTPAPKT